jgi:hypothetical protein
MFAGTFGLKFMWAGVGASFIVAMIINSLLTKRNVLLIDLKEYARQFSFDTTAAQEKLPELRFALEKYFDKRLVPKRLIAPIVEEIFKIYAARAENFQIEVTIIPADRTILIFRDNGKPELPQSPILDKMSGKDYMTSGDENKLVVVV